MAQIDRAFEVGNGIALDSEVLIYYTFSDPTSGDGYEAPKGSILVHKPPVGDIKVWLKTGDSNTDWDDITDTKGHKYKVDAGDTLSIPTGRQFDHLGRFLIEGRLVINGRFVLG